MIEPKKPEKNNAIILEFKVYDEEDEEFPENGFVVMDLLFKGKRY